MKPGILALIGLAAMLVLSGCVQSNSQNNSNHIQADNPLSGGTGGTGNTGVFEFTVPSELPVATVGQQYAYTFQAKGERPEYRFSSGGSTGTTKPEDINLSLGSDGRLEGIPADGSEGTHIIETCTWDPSVQDVCRKTTLYVMSNIVTFKGVGEVKTSMLWLPGNGKSDAGIWIELSDALQNSSAVNYSKTTSVYDFPTQGTEGSTWNQEYQMIGAAGGAGEGDMSHGRDANTELFSLLKYEPLSDIASIPPNEKTGGASGSASVDIKTSADNGSTRFDANFGASASAPCCTSAYCTSSGDVGTFYTDSYDIGGKFTPALELTNTGTSDRTIDITAKGTISRVAAHSPSDASGRIAIGVLPTTHFYKTGDVPESDSGSRGQYAEPVNGGVPHAIIDIKLDGSASPESSADSSTMRFVLAPGSHLIPLNGVAAGISFDLMDGGSEAGCKREDGISGSLTIEVTPVS